MRSVISIDWFACTVKNLSPQYVIEELLLMEMGHFSLNEWGINKYQFHYSCGEINVYFNHFKGDDRMGVFFQLKGQGCRQYSEFFEGNDNNWVALTARFYDHRANFTRYDICHDLYCGKLKIATIHRAFQNGQFVGTARKGEYHETFMTEEGEIVGETIVIGAEGSQQLVIYNKLMEQADKGVDVSKVDDWIRVELRLRGEKANLIAEQIVKKRPLKDIFFESIKGHYRFVVPNSKIKTKRKRPTVKWWADYLETEVGTRLSIKREKPTLQRKEHYLEHNVSKSLAKVYEARKQAFGETEANRWLVYKMLDRGTEKFTDADRKEIEQYVREQQNDELWGY